MKFRRADALVRQDRLAGVAGTLLVHGAAAALVVAGMLRPTPAPPLIYKVDLIAAPAQSSRRTAPVPAPAPTPPPKVDPKPVARPKPTPKTPAKVNPKAEAPPARSTETPNPGVTPKDGNAVENVSVVGKEFPFPDYLNRVVNEIMRRWARPAGTVSLEAEIAFTILKDGSVRDIRVTRSSRRFAFDLEAQGAVEQAGEEKAFGPLPRGWDSDILQIAFLFTPRRNP